MKTTRLRAVAAFLFMVLLVSAALVVFLPRPAFSLSPPSLVQVKQKSALSSGESISIYPTSSIQLGDLMVLTFASNSTGDGYISVINDNLSNTWNFQGEASASCFGDVSIRCEAEVWTANVTTAGAVDVTLTMVGATEGYYAVFYELKGYTDVVTPFRTGYGVTTPTAVLQTGGYPPNAFIVATISNFNDSGTWTAGSGFTGLTGSATPLFSAEYRAGFNGNSSVPFAYSGYLDWVEVAAVFAPMEASGGTTTTTQTSVSHTTTTASATVTHATTSTETTSIPTTLTTTKTTTYRTTSISGVATATVTTTYVTVHYTGYTATKTVGGSGGASSGISQTTNVVLQFVPVVVLIAVLGLVVGVFKRFGK